MPFSVAINKLPLLDFVNADYTYAADFDWQASSQSYVDQVGNVIQNTNNHNLGLDIDFEKLYKNVGLTKLFNKKQSAITNNNSASNLNTASARSNRAKSSGSTVKESFYNLLTAVKKARLN